MEAHTQQQTSMFPGSVFHKFVKYDQDLCPGDAQDPEIRSNKDGFSQTRGISNKGRRKLWDAAERSSTLGIPDVGAQEVTIDCACVCDG